MTNAAAEPAETPHPSRRDRPWLFGLLVAPQAVLMNGVIQGGVLGFLLAERHVSDLRTGAIISLLSWPTMIYFLWSPVTDFLMPRRWWLLMGAVTGGALMSVALLSPDLGSPGSLALMFASACIGQLVTSSCGGMMGALRSERARRLAGSFYQAGSLAFGACSVFLLISVSQGAHARRIAPLAGILIALPALFALAAPKDGIARTETIPATRALVARELKATFLRWKALPYTITLLAPITSGAAVGLLTGQARYYGVGGQQVAWMNGIGGALLTASGSLVAGLIPSRLRASVMYCTVGVLNGATLLVLWLGPLRPAVYFSGVALYLFTVGAGYALFTAVVLEFLGPSGKSGSTRYSVINSLGNVPVVYMTTLDGWGGNHWGARGLAGTECVLSVLSSAVLLAFFVFRHRVEAAEERRELAPPADGGAIT